MTRFLLLVLLGIALSVPVGLLPAHAQEADEPDEPLLEELRRRFKSEPLSLGALVQVVGDYQFDRAELTGHNGFSIGNARLNLRGTLDGGFGYFVQTSFASSLTLLDARLSYTVSPALTVDAGLFKSPFSAEFLISAAAIDFVNRSQAAGLAPNRQVGVGVRGRVSDGLFRYNAGLFNGNGRRPGGNTDDKFLFVGRLELWPLLSEGAFQIGGNVAYGEETVDMFPANRRWLGADARLTLGRILLAAEVIQRKLNVDDRFGTDLLGYYLTAGYLIVPDRHQVLIRWDSFDRNDTTDVACFLVFGYNFWPTSAFELQLNYLLPLEDNDRDKHQILVNFQVAF